MSTTECQCGRPTRDDAYVCEDCLDRLARALGDVTWLDAELDTTIAKQKAAGDAGAPSAETALPYDTRASELRTALRHELVMLIRFCDEEGIRSSDPSSRMPDAENTIVAMSRWLLWRVDGLAFNDMAEEFVASVVKAVGDCRRVIDLPPERAYAGPCIECKRDLYHQPSAVDVKCPGCGQVFVVAEVVAWMQDRINEHMADRLVTAREGATLLGRLGIETKQGTIDKWHERKHLAEAGRTTEDDGKAGHRLYRWDDLLTLAARHAKAS